MYFKKIIEKGFPGSIIHTDEVKIYQDLIKLEFEHGTVCHKYNFM